MKKDVNLIKKKGSINTSKKFLKKIYLNKSFLKRNLANILKYKFFVPRILKKNFFFFLIKINFKKKVSNMSKKNLLKSILFLIKNYFYYKKTP